MRSSNREFVQVHKHFTAKNLKSRPFGFSLGFCCTVAQKHEGLFLQNFQSIKMQLGNQAVKSDNFLYNTLARWVDGTMTH